MAHHHEHLARRSGNLRRTAPTRQSHPGGIVRTDDRRVEIPETVDLRGAEKPDIDTSGLEPIREYLRHRHHGVGGFRQLTIANGERQHIRLGADGA